MDLSKEISTLYRKMHVALNIRLEQLELSISQVMFLHCLSDHGAITQASLCKYLGLDKSTVAKSLVRLEEDGFITKKTNPEDVRSFLVSLTPKALELVPATKEIVSQWGEDVTAEMTDIEKDAFCKLLTKAATSAKNLCGESSV